MTLGGFVTPFVVPPLNLAGLAALALLAGRRRLCGVALALLLLLAIPAVPDLLLAALERGEQGNERAGAQAIVVLGAEVVRQDDGRTVPGLLTLQRLRSAAALARRTDLPILVSGGVTQRDAAPVADAMADSLRDDFATPPRWVEDRSRDTFENARDSATMLAAAGVTTVLLVTNKWHMRRALIAFRAAGLHAIPEPVAPQLHDGLQPDDFVPRVDAWVSSYYALHEWIGIGWYHLRAAL